MLESKRNSGVDPEYRMIGNDGLLLTIYANSNEALSG